MRRHRSFDPTVEITSVKQSGDEQRPLHDPAEITIDKDEDETLLIATAGVAGLMLAAYLVRRRRLKRGGNA